MPNTNKKISWSESTIFWESRATFKVKSFEVEDSYPLNDIVFLLNQAVQAEITAVVLPLE